MRRPLQKLFWIMAPVLVMWGCSSGNNPDAPRPHPSNEQWVSQHGDVFIETGGTQCRTCHGENLTGASAIGCGVAGYRLPSGETILCHGRNDNVPDDEVANTGPFGHAGAEGFMDNALSFHGNFAKGPPQMDPSAPFGFEECTDCHGGTFSGRTIPGPSGGTTDTANCNTQCHTIQAPHSPPEDWVIAHRLTDPGNGESCAPCHGLPNAPETPSCFNGLMCHTTKGPIGEHLDGDWITTHGSFARLTPAAETPAGFMTCNGCHGSKFSNNQTNNADACATCHGINAPHPEDEEWEETTHKGTDPSNALVCAWCHRKSDATPGCFNNSLCH